MLYKVHRYNNSDLTLGSFLSYISICKGSVTVNRVHAVLLDNKLIPSYVMADHIQLIPAEPGSYHIRQIYPRRKNILFITSLMKIEKKNIFNLSFSSNYVIANNPAVFQNVIYVGQNPVDRQRVAVQENIVEEDVDI